MNSYKQEYMTEFGYILGTMQKEYGNIIDKFPPTLTENQDGIKIFNEFVEFMVNEYLSTNKKDYEGYIKENINELKEEFVNMERTDKWKNINNIALKYYDELEPIEKNHLSDFAILNSINSILDKPSLKTQERLLEVINNVWLKDEEHISESKVADEICEAFKNKEITLDSLEETDSRDLLQCVYGYDNFSQFNEHPFEQNEYIEDLFEKSLNTKYKNNDNEIIIIDQGIIIGSASDIIDYLRDENAYLREKSNSKTESYETIIRNNETVIEEIKEDMKLETIIGIEWDKEYGIYNVMENQSIIDRLEDILENKQEEENEESL